MLFRRKSAQRKHDYDGSYSTLNRENPQQVQPQSLNTPAELYDQIQLSPSTGQTEFISGIENVNNSPPPLPLDIYPSVNIEQPKYPISVIPQTTSSNLSPYDEEESTSEQPTYAVVNKPKKRVREKESVQDQEKEGDPVSLYNINTMEQDVLDHQKQKPDIHEGRYDTVNKKSKKGKANAKDTPSHTADSPEELYTVIKKKPKGSVEEDEEEAPPLPPHTFEELYTAVKKKSKSSVGEEEPPSLPPHTVEEIYTAVQKY